MSGFRPLPMPSIAGSAHTRNRSDQFRRRSVSRSSLSPSHSRQGSQQPAVSPPLTPASLAAQGVSSPPLLTISEFKKSLDDEYAQIKSKQDGNKNLCYVCVDIEEDDKKGGFNACAIKSDADENEGITYRLSQGRAHKLIVSILQVDHNPFILESFCVRCNGKFLHVYPRLILNPYHLPKYLSRYHSTHKLHTLIKSLSS